ncbi:hypothetical protein [Micromonospora sp. NPDC000668]|uniref:hypothetical protein n=1 Tax=Micromonospora sp. NPDC000668 TaxID=3364219 RepID=UPI0036C0E783
MSRRSGRDSPAELCGEPAAYRRNRVDRAQHRPEGEQEAQAYFTAMVDDVRRRQEAGELAAGLDPAYVLLMLFAATLAPTVLPKVVRRVTRLPADSQEFLDTYADQLGKIMAHLAGPTPAA